MWGGMFWGVVLICLEYLFTSAKTDEFWENRDGEALSQLSLCPPSALPAEAAGSCSTAPLPL